MSNDTKNLKKQFLFDELERLIKAEDKIIDVRNTIITQSLTGVGISIAFLASILRDGFISTEQQLQLKSPSSCFLNLLFTLLH